MSTNKHNQWGAMVWDNEHEIHGRSSGNLFLLSDNIIPLLFSPECFAVLAKELNNNSRHNSRYGHSSVWYILYKTLFHSIFLFFLFLILAFPQMLFSINIIVRKLFSSCWKTSSKSFLYFCWKPSSSTVFLPFMWMAFLKNPFLLW